MIGYIQADIIYIISSLYYYYVHTKNRINYFLQSTHITNRYLYIYIFIEISQQEMYIHKPECQDGFCGSTVHYIFALTELRLKL